MNVAEIKEKAEPIFRKHGFIKVGIFGSHARGEAGPDSDIDFLYSSKSRLLSFDERLQAEEELEAALGREVDLVPDTRVVARMRPFIKKDLQIIYEG
jgi:predicted nucleotidyltransferase